MYKISVTNARRINNDLSLVIKKTKIKLLSYILSKDLLQADPPTDRQTAASVEIPDFLQNEYQYEGLFETRFLIL